MAIAVLKTQHARQGNAMLLSIIHIFGLLIAFAGFMLLLKPELLLDFISRHAGNPILYASAIVVRLVLGLLLVTMAGLSRFPLVVTVLGWIAVIAAVTIAWIGQDRFALLVNWIMDVITPFSRVGGAFAFVFGIFLLYAFL